jgi:cyanophycin synthetase
MIKNIRIKVVKFLPGASSNLPQKTAYININLTGDVFAWQKQIRSLPSIGKNIDSLFKPSHGNNSTATSNIISSILVKDDAIKSFANALVKLCLAIQREARDPVWIGRILKVDKNTTGYELLCALPYDRSTILKDALQWSARFWLLEGNNNTSASEKDEFIKQYHTWLIKSQSSGLLPNTLRFAQSAFNRGWPIHVQHKTLHIGWGAAKQCFDSSFTSNTSVIATRIARDKYLTSHHLRQAGLPVPPSIRVTAWDSACKVAQKYGWPVVIKPANQDQGIGVVPNICNETELRKAYDLATRYSPHGIIVEKHIPGEDYRLLVVKGKFLMAVRRKPGGVHGDGVSTIVQLIEKTNADPRRGTDKRSIMIALSLDDEAVSCLEKFSLTPQSVLEEGIFVPLRRTANISTGGTAEDATNEIHIENQWLAERAARTIGLDIAGVDFLTTDISRSWHEVGGSICEVNAQPGLRPHWISNPSRDINGEILDLIFEECSPRIPTAAITGTNGKTTVSKMLHHIWQNHNKITGVCTTQGVWIGSTQITSQNLSGYPGARLILEDPTVEAAIFEMPRKGLIRFGHPCDKYDVAALLNVQDDHIGIDGIRTFSDMTRLKSQVLSRASKAIVVNAEDIHCLDARQYASVSRHILVARNHDNIEISKHRDNGGEVIFISESCNGSIITYAQGANETQIMRLHEIPATMDGLLGFNEVNSLFAIAMALAQNLSPSTIRNALKTFGCSFTQNPGRYNFISGLPFQLILDYAHNPIAVEELFKTCSKIPVSGRKILVCAIGNRFYHHLERKAALMAQQFDEIHITQKETYFSQNAHGFDSKDRLGALLDASKRLIEPLLSDNQSLILGRDYDKVIAHAFKSANPGDLLVLLAEPHDAKIIIDRLKE